MGVVRMLGRFILVKKSVRNMHIIWEKMSDRSSLG